MRTVDHAISQEVPEALWTFLRESCRIPAESFYPLPALQLPERDRRLLVHAQDMTSTLAGFHGSALRVEVLQLKQSDDLYLREVFLHAADSGAIVEYGVIAIALDQFAPEQRAEILAGRMPLGGLLHRFQIPFVSAPIGFFSISPAGLAATPLAAQVRSTCHGRFNRLTKPGGEPLAWILEILPPE
jgi:hypothetical protein